MTSCFSKRALISHIRQKDSNMQKLGFTSVTFRKLSREEICIIAKENGVEYIEWGGDIHLPPDDENALAEVISLQKKYGIKPLSYGSYYRIGQKDYELFEKILSVSEKIGCRRIRLWLGTSSSDKTDKKLFDSLVEETQKLCDMSKEKGITLSFEFHEGTFNDNGKSSLEFLKAVNEIEMAYFDKLSADVSWFCKKFDYRYDEEPWYNSKDSVERSMKFLRSDIHKTEKGK